MWKETTLENVCMVDRAKADVKRCGKKQTWKIQLSDRTLPGTTAVQEPTPCFLFVFMQQAESPVQNAPSPASLVAQKAVFNNAVSFVGGYVVQKIPSLKYSEVPYTILTKSAHVRPWRCTA